MEKGDGWIFLFWCHDPFGGRGHWDWSDRGTDQDVQVFIKHSEYAKLKQIEAQNGTPEE